VQVIWPFALAFIKFALAVTPALRGFLFALCLGLTPRFAGAEEDETPRDPKDAPIAPGVEKRPPYQGRPQVRLDQLVFPAEVQGRAALERHFRRTLSQAARKADWGAGVGAKIEYRVTVEALDTRVDEGVLRVRCTALGRLPKGKSARSHIEFGGSPSERQALLRRVLEIVARGVITRLAALERERRQS
jgi:hypothetical protein